MLQVFCQHKLLTHDGINVDIYLHDGRLLTTKTWHLVYLKHAINTQTKCIFAVLINITMHIRYANSFYNPPLNGIILTASIAHEIM